MNLPYLKDITLIERGLLEKGSFQKSPLLEIIENLDVDSREPPECGK